MEEQTTTVPSPVSTEAPIPERPLPPRPRSGFKPILLAVPVLILVGLLFYVGFTLVGRQPSLDTLFAKKTPTVFPTEEPIPTTNPILGWQTYEDSYFHYQIKWPTGWKPVEHSSNFYYLTEFKASDESGVRIEVKDNKYPTLEQYLQAQDKADLTSWEGKPSKNVLETKQTSLGSYKAVEREEEWLAAGFVTRVTYAVVGNQVYTFTIFANGESKSGENEAAKNYDLILSTFKILPSTSPSPKPSPGTPVKIKSISLASPTKGPLVIKGTVEAGWMFEGVFPVKLLDASRQEIATGSAKETTPGSWQSGKAVEFSVSLTFTTQSSSGFLIFQNDNPSGLPENSKSFEIPVKFKSN